MNKENSTDWKPIYAVGDLLRITGNNNCHGFKIGEEVRVHAIDHKTKRYICENDMKIIGGVIESDVELVSKMRAEMKDIIRHQIKPFFIKSIANNGDRAKQYFMVISDQHKDRSIIITKRVLTKDYALYFKLGYRGLRRFKDYYMLEYRFGIKLETMNRAMEIIDNALKTKE